MKKVDTLNPQLKPAKLGPVKNGFFYPSERLQEQRLFFEHGVMPALYDALWLVRELGAPAPEWVIEGALQVVAERLVKPKTTGSGSKGNEGAKFKSDTVHLVRWRYVRKSLENDTGYLDAYENVAEELEGTFAAGGPDAIKNSYKIVQSGLSDPKKCFAFYNASAAAKELTGTKLKKAKVQKA